MTREKFGIVKMSIGLQSDGSVNLDFAEYNEQTGSRWSQNNLSLEQAEFVLEELASVVERVQARIRLREQQEAETQRLVDDAYDRGKQETIKELRARF